MDCRGEIHRVRGNSDVGIGRPALPLGIEAVAEIVFLDTAKPALRSAMIVVH